ANITVTATNGICSATKVIQVDHQPTATVTTPTQAQCNSANFSLVATQNTFGTGTWSCVANCTGVTINSPNSYNAASASGVPVNTTTTVQWAIANGTCSSSTTETLRNDNQASISGSTALCVSDPNMQFNSSGAGTNPTPVWSVSPSTAGTITSGGLFTANAISGSTVSIPVTINLLNGTCLATYSTTLWNAVSIVPISNMCETDPPVTLSATINGNTVYGNPVSGPTFTGTGGTVVWNATLSRYIFTPPSQSGNSTNYNITVRSGSDSYCSDFQTVTVYKNTSGSVAGANQALCNTSTFSLAANNPTVGVGTWTISGTGTITSPSAYNTTVTGVPVGTTATLTWTIVNGSCNSSSSLTLTNSATATTSNAGTFQENCNIPTFTLAGNQPTVGSGLWTGSGTGTITTPTAYNSTVTGVPAGSSFVATWTITNGACSSNSSVTLQNDLAPTDIAPTVQSNPICGGTGTNIQILGSQIGVNYQLQTVSGPTNVGSPVAGTGGTISLPTGNLASNTTYDVKATYAATGCTRTMTVTPTVVVTAPDFAIGAQIVHTNFGAINNTVLPAGWGNAANTNGDNWALNSTNPATGAPYQYYNAIGGYTAASTGAYAKTPSNTTSSTPTVELVSASINTTGFSNVSVYWGAKKTTDYTGTVSLFYSIDNGVNWISQSFIDVASNVTGNPWNLANNTVQIKLPVTTSNITTLKLKWVANPSTDNSYYSINDVSVYGLSKINLCGTTLSVNYLNTSCSVSKYSVVSDPLNPWPAFSAVNNASLPATINITYPANTAAGTYNLDLSLSTASGASSGVISFPVTTEPGISATVNLDNCSCMDGSSVAQSVVSVYATGGGSGNFTFTPLNGTDVLQTVITGTGQSYSGGSHTGVKGVFWSKADGLPHNYQVSDAQCTVTVTQHTQNGAPTQIAFASSSQVPASLPGQGGGNGISGSYNNSGANSPGISSSKVNGPALTCHQTADFGNRWVTYIANNMDVNGNPNTNDSTNNKAMIEINNYGQELDSVAVSVYREPFLPSVPSSSGANSVCYLFPAYALERHYVIQSTKSTGANSFGSDVGVRLYFSDAELQDLIYWTNYAATVNASTVNASCASAQIVNNTGQLYVTKYTGPAEDGNYGNNTAAPTGLYRMFGPNTSLAGNGPIAAIDGGNGVFGNSLGANRHYVEFNVREFSELWLSGSGDIEPLPVEMIYFEAEAINNEYIQLGWATDIEINNKEFQVERSVDGNTWSQIGTVEGHGNSTTKITYTFDDMNVVPNVRYYYRLKQVDFNLQYKYTGIVSAEINGNGTFNVSVSPNPTYGTTNLIINTSKDQNITVDVYDVIGQKMVSGNNQLTSGYNRIQLELGHLASGTYSVTVTSANQVYTKKLVITK
ncbi:MAG: hypothetical protein JWO06_1812, partial [Bacteroidota bacterium]|nr:hypothetical protein [Bacteroidota bacterium]